IHSAGRVEFGSGRAGGSSRTFCDSAKRDATADKGDGRTSAASVDPTTPAARTEADTARPRQDLTNPPLPAMEGRVGAVRAGVNGQCGASRSRRTLPAAARVDQGARGESDPSGHEVFRFGSGEKQKTDHERRDRDGGTARQADRPRTCG